MRGQRLECDRPPEPPVGREIDAPHAPASNLADNSVRADAGAGRQRLLVQQQIGRLFHNRVRQKGAGARVMLDERQHFVADDGIVRRFARDPAPGAGGRIAIQSRLEQIAHSSSLVRRHAGPLRSRKSQARASAQRRFTVAGEMPSASAVSSMLRPAK